MVLDIWFTLEVPEEHLRRTLKRQEEPTKTKGEYVSNWIDANT